MLLWAADWKVTTTVWNNKDILDVEMGRTLDDCYGVAIDLGAAKIVTSLVSLITGKTIDILGDVNPQISYGEDVLSRIHYALSYERGR